MVRIRPSQEKNKIFNSLIVALLHSFQNCAKPVEIDFNLNTFYKQYFHSQFDVFLMAQARPSQENKIKPNFVHCSTSALLPKQFKNNKKSFWI